MSQIYTLYVTSDGAIALRDDAFLAEFDIILNDELGLEQLLLAENVALLVQAIKDETLSLTDAATVVLVFNAADDLLTLAEATTLVANSVTSGVLTATDAAELLANKVAAEGATLVDTQALAMLLGALGQTLTLADLVSTLRFLVDAGAVTLTDAVQAVFAPIEPDVQPIWKPRWLLRIHAP